ncbi:uncharacterized protein OCT59_000752 [Rhizophagus irregularis]|uniref:uncharacterized protein n=1 Tax=Rhizophagus irregularis TaxID=588596 RepID=UPI0019F61240|nr:hypothetical protein OCT59_000752 [Rhizophagus irregularis]GBC13474.2 hypothetical protein GLOIN_2v1777725 [Rhizophagus irregularis DAOM 181602=DAOM 197198]
MFWNNIESSVINLSLQLDKINTARTVIHGTERLIKTALNEVDSTLKTDGGFVFNNILNERPAEETLSKGVFPIRNIDNIINAKTSSKKGLNCEKNNDVVTKQCKIEDKLQDLPIEATCTEGKLHNTLPLFAQIVKLMKSINWMKMMTDSLMI